MTEQLKKAAKSTYSMKMSHSEAMKTNPVLIPFVDVSCLAKSIFNTAEGEYKSMLKPQILQKGKTNWQNGDIVLLRSWIYIWLLKDVQQPKSASMTLKYHINTSVPTVYSTSLTERTVNLSVTPGGYNIPYCSSAVMDTLVCKVENGGLYTVSPVDERDSYRGLCTSYLFKQR